MITLAFVVALAAVAIVTVPLICWYAVKGEEHYDTSDQMR